MNQIDMLHAVLDRSTKCHDQIFFVPIQLPLCILLKMPRSMSRRLQWRSCTIPLLMNNSQSHEFLTIAISASALASIRPRDDFLLFSPSFLHLHLHLTKVVNSKLLLAREEEFARGHVTRIIDCRIHCDIRSLCQIFTQVTCCRATETCKLARVIDS